MKIKTPPKIHAYAYHIWRAWYSGSYTMATKPIKYLELHYTMTQFLIIPVIGKQMIASGVRTMVNIILKVAFVPLIGFNSVCEMSANK